MKSLVLASCIVASMGIAAAQNPGTRPPAPPPPPRLNPNWPVRDAHTPGYIKATELPDGTIPQPELDGNFILGPSHPPAPELDPPETELRGSVVMFTMNSADSKIYPGIGRDPGTHGTPDPNDHSKMIVTTSHPMAYTRKVGVYVPKEYKHGKLAPFIVGADGPDRLLFATVDKLIHEGKLPPMIVISIANGSDGHGDAQGSERGFEYDTVSGRYAEFVETEVLPRVEAEAHVKLSHDPDARATTGGSSGGAAAFSMAWFHPEWYHRVLTFSGTYVNQQWPYNPETPHAAWEFHEHLIPESERKPIRIWMEVADQDMYNLAGMNDGFHDWTLANENMARVLASRGYHYQFLFAKNAGHVDKDVKYQTLPEALEYVWQGYKPPTR